MSLAQLKIIPIKGHQMERENERSIETLKEFHRVLRRSLRPPVYSVFCAIEDHAGTTPPEGLPPFTCFASDKTLAKEASVSRATVIRAVEELTGLGLIKVEDREGYTSLIWPLVTNQGYIRFMEEQEIRESQKATCSSEQQGVLHKATGGVAQSDTNETKLKKPKNETNKDIAVSGETGPTTIDLPVLTETLPKPSSRQAEVQPAVLNQEGRPEAGGVSTPKQHNPPVPRAVPKPEPKRAARPPKEPDPNLQDPRLQTWRKYADLAEYGPWPNGLQRQMILETVKEEPKHLDRWDKVLKYWVGHDWQVKNVEGLLEVFVNGVKKRGN
jgi:DNA-binding transcriptional regulator YhcF (GntR family)